MQNILNTQKSISSNRSVLAYSEVTSAKKSGGLGKHTKFCEKQAQQGFTKDKKKQDYKKLRYKTQSIIQKIMSHASGTNRVCNCLKKRIDSNLSVGISYNESYKTASYSNLQLCDSKWICPVCSEISANQRKEELKEDLILLEKRGFYAHMLTLTVPHSRDNSLEDTLSKLSKAKSKLFKDGLALQNEGHITSLEVKYSSENGWHPHLHLIVITDKKYSEHEMKGTLGVNPKNFGVLGYEKMIGMQWQKYCKSVGLKEPSLKHGVDLKRGYDDKKHSTDELIDYILKDDLSNEMTKSHTKIGKYNTDSVTPFQLALLAENEEEHSPFAVLFREYAKAIKGKNNGKKSPKLVKLLDKIKNPIGPQLPASEDDSYSTESPVLVYELQEKEWRVLCSDHESKGKLLILIEQDISDHGITTSKFPKADSFLNRLLEGSRGGISPAHELLKPFWVL